MSNAPVCHVSTGSEITTQPRATLLNSIPAAIDLPSAIRAINMLKLLIQVLSGQQQVSGPLGVGAFGGLGVGNPNAVGSVGGGVTSIRSAPGDQGQKGKDGKEGKENDRFTVDRSQRVTKKKRIFQNNDKKSENWVDIEQINHVVWVDRVTGGRITWTR